MVSVKVSCGLGVVCESFGEAIEPGAMLRRRCMRGVWFCGFTIGQSMIRGMSTTINHTHAQVWRYLGKIDAWKKGGEGMRWG